MVLAITPTSATAPSSELPEGLALLSHWRSVVEEVGACALPGVSVKYDTFIPCMWKAVARGFVPHEDAVFVGDGLRNGFTAGVDVTQLTGHRWFTNYKSALEGRDAVTRAIMKRVESGKTLRLGTMTHTLAEGIKRLFGASAIFPVGAVKKALEAGELRPTDDHSRTGLNAATSLEGLRHSLNAYSEISWFLQLDHFMRVSDVEGAFTLLPLHPDVWPFFLFRFFADTAVDAMLELFCHVCGDFGAAGMPGTFHRFFTSVIVGMARSENTLTLPMAVYVDDCALMGQCREQVDAEMLAFHLFCATVCGVYFKVIKDRVANQRQLALGFWWDSRTLTRELEERKLLSYVDLLSEYAARDTLTLREMQSVAGRMQRCIMTFPPGAAFLLVPVFALMAKLKLPHHRRRTNKEVRDNFKYTAGLLTAALGRGYYSFANFARAPPVWTDASKSGGYAGGGFVSADGTYDFWQYGSRAARNPIDELEGDTVVVACTRMAYKWAGCIVTIFCDNKAFQASGAKGRSKAERLNNLVKELFLLMVQFCFVLDLQWISTHDNVNADHLSRKDREADFLQTVYESDCWSADTQPNRLEGAGRKRVMPEKRGTAEAVKSAQDEQRAAERCAASDRECADFTRRAVAAAGPPRFTKSLLVLSVVSCFCVQGGESMPLSKFDAALTYSTASVFDGLPDDFVSVVEQVMDNRLSTSSWRKVSTGMKLWRAFADRHEWSPVIRSGDPMRGGKLAAFVTSLMTDTELVYKSIETYVWAVRTYMQAQHEDDPCLGVKHWQNFMDGIKVLTFVPAEPRKMTPMDVIEKILDAVNLNSFWEVQLAFLILVCLYTFSRTECPCPKSFDGRDSYDPDVHFGVRDVDVENVGGRRALKLRFRVIKQDQRVERPEARGEGDWVYLGAVEKEGQSTKWCPLGWFLKLQRFHGPRADKKEPLFLDPDMRRPLIYRKFGQQFKDLQARVGVAREDFTMPHGLRVRGFNNTKAGLGVELAVAHGGWKSLAFKRYDRFGMSQVVRIPAVISGLDDGDDSGPLNEPEEREAGPPQRRLRRSDLRQGSSLVSTEYDEDDEDDEEEEVSEEGEPDGSSQPGSDDFSHPQVTSVLHLTPGGTARPGGYWGSTSRPAPRSRSPTGRAPRRSPSRS